MSHLPLAGTIIINETKAFPLKICTSRSDIILGMSGSKTMDYALAFPLEPINSPTLHGFWMKDCLFPLDMVFCVNGKITTIYHSVEPCLNLTNCPLHYGLTDTVIEMPGGTCKVNDIKQGDTYKFKLF